MVMVNNTEKKSSSVSKQNGAIGARVFEIIKEKSISQKELAQKAGILESTISTWKKTGQNPGADKIMPICRVLNVSPYYLLEGKESVTDFVIEAGSEDAVLLEGFHSLDKDKKNRLLGYLDALKSS